MTVRIHETAGALAVLLVVLTAFASQDRSSTPEPVSEVKVIVSDATGAVIPLSKVLFKGELGTIVAHTTMDGSVKVKLRNGKYTVTVFQVGFVTSKPVDFQINAPTPFTFRTVLQVAGTPTDGGGGDGTMLAVPTIPSDLPNIVTAKSSAEPSAGGDLGLVTLGEGTFTGYPPSVYMQFFSACSADKPCTRREEFRVGSVPKGCCVLTVTNGDGRGTDEVRRYEIFLNGQRVLTTGKDRNAQAAVKVRQDNTLKVILIGGPRSKVFILIAYDPRESN
jgi:hypothetical protein